ncbi:hypothetical protein RFI_34418 [Reticulomyxa filosa]|uniref:BZIP domain-containing protein n=1 Tax=Reticulomyxa filosa TaxID=46433 RepID=X6LPC8_RETFI|nr:hypothetical protein RFI_34418 [Reticulomyxa filosa]|eukprot:ETO02992.1 hypothetical protein RFI_34418 [Reticulomyxa filosa]
MSITYSINATLENNEEIKCQKLFFQIKLLVLTSKRAIVSSWLKFDFELRHWTRMFLSMKTPDSLKKERLVKRRMISYNYHTIFFFFWKTTIKKISNDSWKGTQSQGSKNGSKCKGEKSSENKSKVRTIKLDETKEPEDGPKDSTMPSHAAPMMIDVTTGCATNIRSEAKVITQGRLTRLKELSERPEERLSTHQRNEKKRIIRLEKNRRAAAMSRRKKKMYIKNLEQRATLMAKHLAILEMENNQLRGIIHQLSNQLGACQMFGGVTPLLMPPTISSSSSFSSSSSSSSSPPTHLLPHASTTNPADFAVPQPFPYPENVSGKFLQKKKKKKKNHFLFLTRNDVYIIHNFMTTIDSFKVVKKRKLDNGQCLPTSYIYLFVLF